MKKKGNKSLTISTILCLLPIILGLMLYDRLPGEIAIHFDHTGRPDNYLPKSRRNFTIENKLPWTLDSEQNWRKTHRFAGFVWVIGGLIFTASAFFSVPYISIAIIVLLVVLPFGYSYLTYTQCDRKESLWRQ